MEIREKHLGDAFNDKLVIMSETWGDDAGEALSDALAHLKAALGVTEGAAKDVADRPDDQ